MSELTDLEICKKIAEIKDVYYIETQYKENNFLALVDDPDGSGTPPEIIGKFDPFNDALCFKLMIEFGVALKILWEENNGTKHYNATLKSADIDNKSPKRAILLAIIESKKNV